MKLRRKLLTIFGGLGLLAACTAGVTVWAIAQWGATNDQLRNHYQRSLLLQRVRAATFRAFKEVPDAVTGDDPNSREEFVRYLEPAEQDFKEWAALAETKEEEEQVRQVRQAYDELVREANKAFDLVEANRRDEAFQLMEGELEDNDFQKFQELTELAVTSDQKYRKVVLGQVHNTRQTAQLVLAIAAFGTIALILLLTAYLASDLFAPLTEVKDALDDVAKGDLERRLDEERNDEFGDVNQAFNRMAEVMQEREQVMGLVAVPVHHMDGATDENLQNAPSRVMLHQLVSQLRTRVSQLSSDTQSNGDGNGAVAQKQEMVEQLDRLLQAVARVTEFGFPLDLNLSRTDIRALLYEVLLRFHDEFAKRAISFELDIAPKVSYAVVDRLKLREALGEIVRNALAALPEQSARLGVRSSITADGTELLIEVADNGRGIEQPLINRAFSTFDTAPDNRPSVGLKLTRAIAEQHGGKLTIDSEPGKGTYVLCGAKGVARVFGPQKGASPEVVEQMAAALENYAAVIHRDTGIDVGEMPGSGASGGLGTGLHALVGAKLYSRYEILVQYLEIDHLLEEVDLVITGEGCIDTQTPRGKIPAEVARRAGKFQVPTIALAGTIGKEARENFEHGIDSFVSILEEPCTLEEAIGNAPELLTNAAERVMRLLLVGQKLDRI